MRATPVSLVLASLLAGAVLSGSSVARADDVRATPAESSAPPPAPPVDPTAPAPPPAEAIAPAAVPVPPRRYWYGFQTLGADAVALVFSVPVFGSHDAGVQLGFAWTTFATYLLGGPFVHLMHGAVGKGFGDLGLRLGTPIVVGLLGGLVGAVLYQSPSCSNTAGSSCDDGLGRLSATGAGVGIGGVLGIAGAIAMDAGLMAYEPVGDGRGDLEPAPRQPHLQAAHVQPSVGFTPERRGGTMTTFGLTGTF